MIFMGADLSTSCSGVGLVNEHGELIEKFKIRPKKSLDWTERLMLIGKDIEHIIDRYDVCKIYAEDVPLMGVSGENRKGKKTFVQLGACQGMILMLAYNKKIPIELLNPTAWRSRMGFFGCDREHTKRPYMKEKAVNYVNKKFGLDLYYKFDSEVVANDDDVAEGICIVLSEINPPKFK